MNCDDFEQYARDLAYKSTYSFTLLSFSTLALSIQFSSNFGKICLSLLYLCWALFLVSCFCGAWIIGKMPIFYKINLAKIRIEQHLDVLNNPDFKRSVKDGTAVFPDGNKWTMDQLERSLKGEQEKVSIAKKNMSDIDGKVPILNKIQAWSFVVAILLNVGFVIINLEN